MMKRVLGGIALTAMFLGAQGVARANWREASTPHFLVYSQGGEKSLRQRAERLEAFHRLLLMSYGLADEVHPYKVRIYVVSTISEVQRLVGDNTRSSGVAGFYQPHAEGPVVFTPEATAVEDVHFTPQVVLFHEYSHHFMLQNFPVAYPSWYVEGHAELVSTASFERDGAITFGKVANHRQDEIEEAIPTYSDILLKPAGGPSGIGLSYGKSWLLTHYLTFAPERKGQLSAYLSALNRGTSQADAAKVFGDLRKLNRDASHYAAVANFTYRAVPIPADVEKRITIRELSADENAMMPLQIDQTRTMKPAEATAFAKRVEQVAAAYPDSYTAQYILTKAELDSKDLTAAQTCADHLIAVSPKVARAHYLRGDVMLERAAKLEGAERVKLASEGRKEIVAANRLDPDDPLPLIDFYKSYLTAGTTPTPVAIDGLARAVEIVPQDEETRLMYARALITLGNKPRAIAILKPLAYSPHQNVSARVAGKMLERLEGREAGDPNAVTEDDVKDKNDPAKPKK